MNYYGHDDGSNDPIPVVPAPVRESRFFKLMAYLGLRERNARDERQAKAAAENLPHRELEARTLAALSRIGRGK